MLVGDTGTIFTNNDDISVCFSINGDKGDTGATGPQGITGSTGATGATIQQVLLVQQATGSIGATGPPGDGFSLCYEEVCIDFERIYYRCYRF